MIPTEKEYNKVFGRLQRGLRARYTGVDDSMLISAITDSYDATIKAAKCLADVESYWVTCAWRKYIDLVRKERRRVDQTTTEDESCKFELVQADWPDVFAGLQLFDDILHLPKREQHLVTAILTNDIGAGVTERSVDSIRGKMRNWYLTNISGVMRDYLKSFHYCHKWVRSMA